MNADRILVQTFADHENLAPDPEATLDAVRHAIRTRRRRAATRTVTVAAAAATVAAVAIGATLAGRAAPRSAAPAARPTAPPSTPAAPVAAPDFTTVAPGWLPTTRVTPVIASNDFGQELRGYTMTLPGLGSTYLLVGAAPGSALPTENKRGVPHDLRIGGRPAREWSVDDWYYLAIQQAPGRVTTIDLAGGRNEGKGGDGSAAALAAIGRQVGAGLVTGRHDPIKAGFRLSYLPAGLTVRGVGWQDATGTSYTLAPPTGPPADETTGYPMASEVRGTARTYLNGPGRAHDKPRPPATPGRPVQGHPTYVVGDPDQPTLFIDSVRPGVSITISSGAGLTELAQLYRIADGLLLR